MSINTQDRLAGDGADRTAHHQYAGRYVYAAKSRRSGGISLGIDITPHGFCTFGCVYCQASHPPTDHYDLHVDVDTLGNELTVLLASSIVTELRDLVFAGSGEPTCAINLGDVLATTEKVCAQHAFHRPRRIFSNGSYLGQPSVVESVGRWIDAGGEIWVKVDGVTNDVVGKINGRPIEATVHLDRIWRFALNHPIGVQTLLVEGPGLPPVEQVWQGVMTEMVRAIDTGSKVTSVHLLTLSRPPSNPRMAGQLRALTQDRLDAMAGQLRGKTGLDVKAFGP